MMWPRQETPKALPQSREGKVSPMTGATLFLLAAIIVIGILLLLQNGGFSRLEPLPTAAYQANPANFLGNRYELMAQVHSLLLWEKGIGRLVALTPDSEPGRVAVFVPEALDVSLHTGQRYLWEISVREGGLLYVEDLEKY